MKANVLSNIYLLLTEYAEIFKYVWFELNWLKFRYTLHVITECFEVNFFSQYKTYCHFMFKKK